MLENVHYSFSSLCKRDLLLRKLKYCRAQNSSIVSSADGCIENGQLYGVGEQWERSYLGSTLLCTCHGVSGIKCKSKPDGESSYIGFVP